MKNFCTLVIISFLATLNLFSQALEELEKKIAADNQIKTKTQIDYSYVSGKVSETGKKTIETTYNRKGEVIQKSTFNGKVVRGSELYEYDARGNRTRFERTGSSVYKKTSQYNDNKDLILEVGFDGAENFKNQFQYTGTKISTAKYTQSGNVTQEIKYTHSGNSATAKVYVRGTHTATLKMKYDAKGNVIEETTLSTDGKELEKKSYTFNASSQLIEESKTRAGEFDYRINYTYTAAGHPKEVIEETRAKNKYTKKRYTYDSNDNLVKYEWRRNPDSEFNSKSYSYNSNGVCLTEETYYPKTKFKRLAKFEYTYY